MRWSSRSRGAGAVLAATLLLWLCNAPLLCAQGYPSRPLRIVTS